MGRRQTRTLNPFFPRNCTQSRYAPGRGAKWGSVSAAIFSTVSGVGGGANDREMGSSGKERKKAGKSRALMQKAIITSSDHHNLK